MKWNKTNGRNAIKAALGADMSLPEDTYYYIHTAIVYLLHHLIKRVDAKFLAQRASNNENPRMTPAMIKNVIDADPQLREKFGILICRMPGNPVHTHLCSPEQTMLGNFVLKTARNRTTRKQKAAAARDNSAP